MSKQSALITGCTGQTGSYLAEYLLQLGYEVHGMVRRSSTSNLDRIKHLLNQIKLWPADLHDLPSLIDVVKAVRPTEIYNLAAMSFVPTSWQQPLLTADITALGATRLLEAIKLVDKEIRFYQSSSSEMFGKVQEEPQTEKTPFYPRSPYGVSKLYAHWITINYRESYGLYACSGIAYNHESERRGVEFVTRKISKAAARIQLELQDKLQLGNLNVTRDWGHAKDYVRAMHLMLQQDEPDDYIIATGEKHSVKEFAELAFKHVGLHYLDYLEIDEKMFRPAEVLTLCGDATKIRERLGWRPEIGFERLVEMMVQNDLVEGWAEKWAKNELQNKFSMQNMPIQAKLS